jgi:hypothetical protein
MAFSAKMISVFDGKAMPSAVFVPPSLRLINPINTDAYVGIPDARQASLLGKIRPRSQIPPFIPAAQIDKKPIDAIQINRPPASKPVPASQDEP